MKGNVGPIYTHSPQRQNQPVKEVEEGGSQGLTASSGDSALSSDADTHPHVSSWKGPHGWEDPGGSQLILIAVAQENQACDRV